MKPYENYNTHPIKKRVPMLIAIALLLGTIALNVFVPVPEPEADVKCPFVNVNVDWLQTHYSGAWGDLQ